MLSADCKKDIVALIEKIRSEKQQKKTNTQKTELTKTNKLLGLVTAYSDPDATYHEDMRKIFDGNKPEQAKKAAKRIIDGIRPKGNEKAYEFFPRQIISIITTMRTEEQRIKRETKKELKEKIANDLLKKIRKQLKEERAKHKKERAKHKKEVHKQKAEIAELKTQYIDVNQQNNSEIFELENKLKTVIFQLETTIPFLLESDKTKRILLDQSFEDKVQIDKIETRIDKLKEQIELFENKVLDLAKEKEQLEKQIITDKAEVKWLQVRDKKKTSTIRKVKDKNLKMTDALKQILINQEIVTQLLSDSNKRIKSFDNYTGSNSDRIKMFEELKIKLLEIQTKLSTKLLSVDTLESDLIKQYTTETLNAFRQKLPKATTGWVGGSKSRAILEKNIEELENKRFRSKLGESDLDNRLQDLLADDDIKEFDPNEKKSFSFSTP